MEDVKGIIAKNIAELRQSNNMTQLELAEKLNYSDKTISKWERAESIPDVIVLKQISDIFGISVDYLLTEHIENEKLIVVKNNKNSKINKVTLTLLVTCPIWTIATIIFTFILIFTNKYLWLVFFISVPLTVLLFLIFNSIWGNRRNNYFIVSIGFRGVHGSVRTAV